MQPKLRCIHCGNVYEPSPKMFTCPKCGNLLEVVIEQPELPPFEEFIKRSKMMGIWRFKELLPLSTSKPITMGEGSTP